MGVVLAPVNGRGAAARLLEAGTGELYMGFYDDAWTDAFGPQAPLNRMSGFGQEANALSFDDLLREVGEVLEAGFAPRGLFCVFNAAGYTARQEDYIARVYFPRLAQAGFTGAILSNAHLVRAAHENGLAAVASTMCAVYNADLAAWHADEGFDRLILPRDLSLDEIGQVTMAVPGVGHEVFLMRNGCVFADSHCMGLHKAGRPSLCRTLRTAPGWRQVPAFPGPDSRGESPAQRGRAHAENHARWAGRFHLNTCGLCALWRFERMGVDAYKVVGRGDDVDDLAADVALVSRNLAIARSCADEESYLAAMERPEGIRALCANEGLSCYYPEVRFG